MDILNLVSPHHTVAGLKGVYEDRTAGGCRERVCLKLPVPARVPGAAQKQRAVHTLVAVLPPGLRQAGVVALLDSCAVLLHWPRV